MFDAEKVEAQLLFTTTTGKKLSNLKTTRLGSRSSYATDINLKVLQSSILSYSSLTRTEEQQFNTPISRKVTEERADNLLLNTIQEEDPPLLLFDSTGTIPFPELE